MATYTYRCTSLMGEAGTEASGCGVFDVRAPIGRAASTTTCPSCGRDAVRVFSPPMISRAHPGALSAIERAERSRTDPEVVTALPGRPGRARRTAPPNPALRRLPRP